MKYTKEGNIFNKEQNLVMPGEDLTSLLWNSSNLDQLSVETDDIFIYKREQSFAYSAN